jgi:beta-glucosidase
MISLACLATDAEPTDQRVDLLLGQMTLGEKLDYISGVHAMSIRSVPRLGLPEIQMTDGPLGVRRDTPSTRYPAGAAAAATWNRSLAEKEGMAMGRDCRARGIHVLLAPGVNIHRVAMNGRNFEYISGEDPFLASQLVVPFIRGVQGQGVVATVKHFAANNQETNREHVNVIIDERTLREIYLPAFEAAVRTAGVGAVMDAYNKVNGQHCTENEFLNIKVLKGEWGFQGVLMSDWGATHSLLGPIKRGLDLEMPSGIWMNQKNLLEALHSHRITEEEINDKVRRILRMIVQMQFLDRPQQDPSIPENDPASARTALEVAREGIVLLKNKNAILPLNSASTHKIAVFGVNADPGVPAGWGSSYLRPFYAISVLDGVRHHTEAQVDYFDVGVGSFQSSTFENPDRPDEHGLKGEYFDNGNMSGTPVVTRIDQHIDFDWVNVNSLAARLPSKFTTRWTGFIRPTVSGTHVFRARADSGIRVFLDDTAIINDWPIHAARPEVATRSLEAGKRYRIRIEYRNSGGGGAIAQFGWASLEVPDSVRDYDAAIVCAGFDEGTEGEGFDRTFELPDSQNELISRVAEKNPKTIVVLNCGGNVDMRPWLKQVPALLHAWYPGQEGGNAVAEILFGQTNPSGKLPVTFEDQKEDNPAYRWYPTSDGGKSVRYGEGIFVGYRGYDHNGVQPLFPFGYGLSYTRFEYSDLKVESEGDSIKATFSIRNAGDRAGAEVAQLYVEPVKPAVERPIKELKGFEKVFLAPGESKELSVTLDERAFAYFDPASKKWKSDPGEYDICIGASSRNIKLRKRITADFRPEARRTQDAGTGR